MSEEKYIICPICESIYPEEVDFCINCGTEFDKETVEKTDHQSEKGKL